VNRVTLPASLAPKEKPAEWAMPAPSLPLQPRPLPLIQLVVAWNVPPKVSITVRDCGFNTALFVFIAISHPLNVGMFVVVTLTVTVLPGVRLLCVWGEIFKHGTLLGGGVGLTGQGPRDGGPVSVEIVTVVDCV